LLVNMASNVVAYVPVHSMPTEQVRCGASELALILCGAWGKCFRAVNRMQVACFLASMPSKIFIYPFHTNSDLIADYYRAEFSSQIYSCTYGNLWDELSADQAAGRKAVVFLTSSANYVSRPAGPRALYSARDVAHAPVLVCVSDVTLLLIGQVFGRLQRVFFERLKTAFPNTLVDVYGVGHCLYALI
jgi:hypothetical protein